MEPYVTATLLHGRAAVLGTPLPDPPTAKGNYQPALIHDGLVYTSGVGPMLNGQRLYCGYVGGDVTVEQAQQAAAVAALNALTSACAAAGGVEEIERLIKLTAFVRSAPGFTQQSTVIDHASGVLHHLMGNRGTHARSAIGVAELPFGICVEIELVAALRVTSSSSGSITGTPASVGGSSDGS